MLVVPPTETLESWMQVLVPLYQSLNARRDVTVVLPLTAPFGSSQEMKQALGTELAKAGINTNGPPDVLLVEKTNRLSVLLALMRAVHFVVAPGQGDDVQVRRYADRLGVRILRLGEVPMAALSSL